MPSQKKTFFFIKAKILVFTTFYSFCCSSENSLEQRLDSLENRIFALESHFKKTSVDDSLGKQKFALLPKIKPEQRFVNKAENNLITESDLEEETSVEASYMHSLNLLQANKSAEAKVQLEEALKENPKEDLKCIMNTHFDIFNRCCCRCRRSNSR